MDGRVTPLQSPQLLRETLKGNLLLCQRRKAKAGSYDRRIIMKWQFSTWQRGDKARDPIQGEFFSTDAIKNPAEAFVREAVQNSLDAGTSKPVRVRFFISGTEGALPASAMAKYMNDAWPHLVAKGNGLREVPSETDSCPFLACEDFSTRGLEG